MKIDSFKPVESSFLGLTKDTSLIMEKVLGNKNLLKLLYYNTSDWEKQSNLTSAQIKELFEKKYISNIPKVIFDDEKKNYLRIAYDSFTPNQTNDFYRDHIVELKVICHFDNWDLGDFELRPYKIAGELDAMLNKQHLSGIGELTFIGADQDVYDNEFGGVTLRYLAIRGNEDKVNPLD